MDIILLVVAFVLIFWLFVMKTSIMITPHAVIVRDISYPLTIDNYAIKSIKIVDKLPYVRFFVGGFRLFNYTKGVCFAESPKPVDEKNSDISLIVENKKSNCFIEIETTFGFVYINKRNEEQTKKLYDEMMETIHFVEESELEMPDKIGKPRSLFIVTMLIMGLISGYVMLNNGFVFLGILLLVTPPYVMLAYYRDRVEPFSYNKTSFSVSEDGIFIDDLNFALLIPNNTIKSVKIIDYVPKVILLIKGQQACDGFRKGIFTLKNESGLKEGRLYVEDNTRPYSIEIVTTSTVIYISLFSEEKTKSLFNEIKDKVKFVEEADLVVYKDKRIQKGLKKALRSIVKIILLFVLYFIIFFNIVK